MQLDPCKYNRFVEEVSFHNNCKYMSQADQIPLYSLQKYRATNKTVETPRLYPSAHPLQTLQQHDNHRVQRDPKHPEHQHLSLHTVLAYAYHINSPNLKWTPGTFASIVQKKGVH